jgi:hypothetical protein
LVPHEDPEKEKIQEASLEWRIANREKIRQRTLKADDRWPKKGDKMTFVGRDGYPHQVTAARKVFTVGSEYEVVDCDVAASSHSIKFVGIDGRWNGVLFQRAKKPDPR